MFVRTASLLSITRRAALRLLAWLLLAPVAAFAQDADPPGRIARLSDAEGSVALQPAGVAIWGAAQLNRPVTTGDRLWSDQASRAERFSTSMTAPCRCS
jgi:hypothetical protein